MSDCVCAGCTCGLDSTEVEPTSNGKAFIEVSPSLARRLLLRDDA